MLLFLPPCTTGQADLTVDWHNARHVATPSWGRLGTDLGPTWCRLGADLGLTLGRLWATFRPTLDPTFVKKTKSTLQNDWAAPA